MKIPRGKENMKLAKSPITPIQMIVTASVNVFPNSP